MKNKRVQGKNIPKFRKFRNDPMASKVRKEARSLKDRFILAN